MLKEFFNSIKAPFRLMGIDIDHLKRCFIVDGMG